MLIWIASLYQWVYEIDQISKENQWLSQVIEAQEGHLCVLALTPCWSGGITRIES